MVETITAVLVVVRLAVLGLAATVTYTSIRAYRRSREPFLRLAAIGFGVITFGVFVEGALFQLGGVSLPVVHIVESVSIGLGFVILLVSLRR